MGPGENKIDGQQGKQPILLSLGLITDVLIMGFSISILLLIALNMPKQDQTQSFKKITFTGRTIQHIDDVMALGLFATLFGWITSMFGGIYSFTILLGKKYNWPCCPGLKNHIQRELIVVLKTQHGENKRTEV